jgi:anti-sigma factor RsiW
MSEDLSIPDETLLRLRHGDAKGREDLAALIEADPSVAPRLAEWDRQDAALATLYTPLAGEPVPQRHRALIAAAAAEPRWSLQLPYGIAAALVLVAAGAWAGWVTAQNQSPKFAEVDLSTAALRAYATYTVEVAHPVEVLASDHVHLETWLSKRIGRPIAPPDLSKVGFQLLGGRVVPDAHGTAALMMYENALGQRVTLYVAPWPTDVETAFRYANGEAAQAFWWVGNKLGCALVGDLPRDVLHQISLDAYAQIDPA